MKGLEPADSVLDATLGRLGIRHLDTLLTLMEQWDEIAGKPWAGSSEPLVIRGTELSVTALATPSVRFLRYAVGDLIQRIDDRFGPGIVESVRVLSPGP